MIHDDEIDILSTLPSQHNSLSGRRSPQLHVFTLLLMGGLIWLEQARFPRSPLNNTQQTNRDIISGIT